MIPPRFLRRALAVAAIGFACNALAEESVSLNFVNADIESVVKAIAHASGKNFLVDPRVKGTVNLVSGKPVAQSMALEILGAALRLQGFAIVEGDGMLKVLPEADAKTQATVSRRKGKLTGGGAQMMTRVFQLRNESAAQLVPVLRPLISPNNTIAAYPGNNTLVITDYADNLARLEQVIDAIDVSPEGETEVIVLKHASAVDVAQLVTKLYTDERPATPGQDGGQRATVLPDARSNSVLLRSENPGKLVRLRNLIANLDTPSAGHGRVQVVRLKHADATELAQLLRATLGGNEPAAAGVAAQAVNLAPPPATGATAGGLNTSGMGALNKSAPTTAKSGIAAGSMIQADIATNSLIITAPDAVYNNLRAVIEQLDKRRAQVHIEALIVELTADKASEFGIQWQSITGKDATRLVGGTNFSTGGSNIVGLAENLAKAGTTGTTGIAPGLNIGLMTGKYDLSALLRALETDAQANILSTPSVVTLDNETAQIVIGQNVPFVTGSYQQTGNNVANPFQTFERKDVGLSLKVRPMITDGGVVRIQIYQEASSLQTSSLSNASGPITNKRALESTVLVDDGSILVLGGLIDDRYNTGEDKVPLLGDAPLLGNLFRYESRKRAKTNLMVFLRPQILRDAKANEEATAGRYDALADKQRAFEKGRRTWSSDGETGAPQLPMRE